MWRLGVERFAVVAPLLAFSACGEATSRVECGPGTRLTGGSCESDTACSVAETESAYIITCPDGKTTVVDKEDDMNTAGESARGGSGGRTSGSAGSGGRHVASGASSSQDDAGAANDAGAPSSAGGTDSGGSSGNSASGGKGGGGKGGGSAGNTSSRGSGGAVSGGGVAGQSGSLSNGGSAVDAGGGGEDTGCTPGTVGCACSTGKSCAGDLVCQSSFCVEPPPTPVLASLGHFALPPGPFDVVLDSERNRVFASYGGDGVVRALDLDEGGVTTVPTGYRAEFLHFDHVRDEVLVSLPVQSHSSYLWTEDQEGYVAAIDATTLADPTPIWLALDPWQLVGDGHGHAIVMGASGQWTDVASVDLATGWYTLVSGPREGTNIRLHPARDRIYGADNGLSPSDIERYNVSTEGVVTNAGDSPYHGDYPMCGDLRIHPSGDTIYTRCGHIFLASNSSSSDMTWVADMGLSWNDLAFDASGRYALVLSAAAKSLYVYDTETLTPATTFSADPADRLFTGPGYLVLVRQATEGAVPYTDVEVLSLELD
jgi:hypothetical protein